MPTVDLVIRGGQVVSPEAIIPASVAIDDGRIVAVGHDDLMPAGREEFRADSLYLLPGAIDSHVHFRDPGYPHKETWATGSAAAACGGVTTVFDMPNTKPPTGSVEALQMKLRAAESSYVDFGIHALLGDDTIDVLEDLLEHGATSFKAFVGNTFGNLPAPTDGALLEAFEILAPLGIRTTVHAENSSIMARRQKRMEEAGRIDSQAHLAARPEVCEIEAVSRIVHFAEWTGARIHVAHQSSADALWVIREAKRRGVDITVETCPQYLLLNTEDMIRLGGVLRVNPPIRDARHNQPLWDALCDGTVDMIATDHAPHAIDEKLRDSIWTCDCGFPGVETQMALMLSEVNKGRATLMDYVRWSSVAPVRAWGLYGSKGVIAPGAHADIAIVDMNRQGVLSHGLLQTIGKLSPWNGRFVQGYPLHTLVRGRFVMREGKLVTEARGWGRSVKSIQKMPVPQPRNVPSATRNILQAPTGAPQDARPQVDAVTPAHLR
ncbi:MAG: allantoinase [Candidatus Dactylopiibacterium carminicum]|uniref:Allantoinase n=1 Tax=Candidatus Dactylopiibacterium carminicum TaxID=857335 RepID=A0A272ERP3_9RHOO|nr:dihydroorotase family protein [Candidatus Dactylopiibacterium carminicum]KAF7598867.1 allantoinase [Candidatus Dactylopiibacterium carminicum]PAS92783.1 MAG: allantoinase [Candidatus Dactylopiibacterium carminicum]PAS96232.1 MAG: allantoinase [Candidatus Dactylopiibacterium carminicum]PAS98884.1 MAG: allantoinase [Candidatus Dactylopiibacterium carminicum]